MYLNALSSLIDYAQCNQIFMYLVKINELKKSCVECPIFLHGCLFKNLLIQFKNGSLRVNNFLFNVKVEGKKIKKISPVLGQWN